jgi:hypothetical protein
MPRANLPIFQGFSPLNIPTADYVAIEVASTYGTAIYPGEPVIGVTDGSVQRTPAGSTAGAATDGITGVCVDIIQYQDANGRMQRQAKFLPASTTWTAHANRSLIMVALANTSNRFRVRATTANSTLAVARATRFANADHLYGTADTGLGRTGCALNLATIGVTATLQWRIIDGWIEGPQNDPTQVDYSLVVIPNLIYALPIVGGATLGV